LGESNALDGVFDKFLSGVKIFLNRNVLRHDYIPDNLPHRGEHIHRLGGILAPSLSGSKVSNVFIYGKTGTGKTAVAKFVLDRLEHKAKEVGAPIKICYVNCRFAGTNYRVLADLCRSVGMDIPFTGLATGEVLDRFRNALNSGHSMLLVVLDEIDALVKRQEDDSLLYELTRINERLHGVWVGLIGISNDLHFKEFLDPRVLSCLSEEEVVFKPYLADELYDILLDRAKKAFVDGALSDSALRLSAALAAGEHGDARRALDLLRVAGELAEREGDNVVTEEHVRLAQQKIEHDRVSEVLRSLPLHSKIVLVGSYILNNHSPQGSVTGDLYEVYQELCRVINIEPLTQRRISGLINELDVMGILNARVVSFGRYGRTKKIRLGVSAKDIIQIYSEDSVAGPLIGYVPKCLQKHRSPA
jgi:cell division control protein 6